MKNDIVKNQKHQLELIPKIEKYIQYMLEVIIKLPRTEKYSIGTEYKNSMYKMLEHSMEIAIGENINKLLNIKNIEVQLNIQRIYLRIMCKFNWIDKKRFDVSMLQIYEIGKILRRTKKILCQKQ